MIKRGISINSWRVVEFLHKVITEGKAWNMGTILLLLHFNTLAKFQSAITAILSQLIRSTTLGWSNNLKSLILKKRRSSLK